MLKAKLILRAIEKFFYRVRFNIALHRVFHSSEYYFMKDKFRDAIRKQILHIATVEKISSILKTKGLRKTEKEEIDKKRIKEALNKYWVPLLAIIDEDEFYQYLLWAANKGGQTGIDKLQKDESFSLRDKKLLQELKKRVKEASNMIDETTKDWLVDKIVLSIEKKISIIDIAKYIKRISYEYAYNRAELIAEYEATLAFGNTELEFYRRNKVGFHRWLCSRDELVCPECIANEEAGEIPIGEMFPSGVMSTPAHINCRCVLIPVVKKEIEIKWTG